jgi:molecular chaperone DnaK (HSP70)
VERIFLTGGATQMPMIRYRLRELSGRDPDGSVHPCEAVARGAALYAMNLLQKAGSVGHAPRFQVGQIATRSLGIQGVDPRTGKAINKVLIQRGVKLPATATEKFMIHPARTREVTITVLEGDSRHADECEVIGKAVLRDFPQDLGSEWPVSVTYQYTASGRLHVEAHLCYTDRRVHLDLNQSPSLSHSQRERWRQLVVSHAGFAAFRAEAHRKRHAPIAFTDGGSPEPENKQPAPPESLLSRAKQWLHGSAEEAPESPDSDSPAN